MEKITLIATATFGLESVVKREVLALGFSGIRVFDGRVEFEATVKDIPRANIWLRCADRLLLKVGEFEAFTFDELFDGVKALDWEKFIPVDGKFDVVGKAVNSQLGSVRACQSIVKKAIVERLKLAYKTDVLNESGAEFKVQISMLKDVATLTIDTSGVGLHKRGYRAEAVEAPLKETLAAALVKLSFWQKDRILIDPMCGSGTILIEAAMIARNIAPGLRREFVSEEWGWIGKQAWSDARKEAEGAIDRAEKLKVFGYDIDDRSIDIAKENANKAGVGEDIFFEQKDIKDLWIDQESGIVISNLPYGIRMGDFKELNEIYITIHKMFKKKLGWSLYFLTADEVFPRYFKRAKPSRIRKLYNGRIKVNYYQYFK